MKPTRYKGVLIERVGLEYKVWFDFVTARHEQPRFDTITQARVAINAAVAS